MGGITTMRGSGRSSRVTYIVGMGTLNGGSSCTAGIATARSSRRRSSTTTGSTAGWLFKGYIEYNP